MYANNAVEAILLSFISLHNIFTIDSMYTLYTTYAFTYHIAFTFIVAHITKHDLFLEIGHHISSLFEAIYKIYVCRSICDNCISI